MSSDFDPYGGGRIPREAIEAFEKGKLDRDSPGISAQQQQQRQQQSSRSFSSQLPRSSTNRYNTNDSNDLDDLQPYDQRYRSQDYDRDQKFSNSGPNSSRSYTNNNYNTNTNTNTNPRNNTNNNNNTNTAQLKNDVRREERRFNQEDRSRGGGSLAVTGQVKDLPDKPSFQFNSSRGRPHSYIQGELSDQEIHFDGENFHFDDKPSGSAQGTDQGNKRIRNEKGKAPASLRTRSTDGLSSNPSLQQQNQRKRNEQEDVMAMLTGNAEEKSSKPLKSNKFSGSTLEDQLNRTNFSQDTLIGQDLDLNSPQFGLFSRNKDLEKHLFNSEERSGESLYLPFDGKITDFDYGFEEKDKAFKDALSKGQFDERYLDGEDDFKKWGYSDKNLEKVVKNSKINDKNDKKISKRGIDSFQYDGSEFEQDELEIDGLLAKLNHISSSDPPTGSVMDQLSNYGFSGGATLNGPDGKQSPWSGFKVPRLSDLGLNPADAGYTDEEIKNLFGDLQFIEGKMARNEQLTKEEEEFELPFTEDILLDRMATIEAKKELKLKRTEDNRKRKFRKLCAIGLKATRLFAPSILASRFFPPPLIIFNRFLINEKAQLGSEFDFDFTGQTFDYNYHPSQTTLGDTETFDHLNYYKRYMDSSIQPLGFVLSGGLDSAIEYFQSDDHTNRLWEDDDDLDQRAQIIQDHDNYVSSTLLFAANPIKEESWFPAAAAQMYQWAPKYDSEHITREDLILSDMGLFLHDMAL